MGTLAWVTAGGILAIGFLRLTRAGDERQQRKGLAVGLIVAALVYVAAATFHRDVGAIAWEGAGVIVFGAMARMGVRQWPILLAIGWATHVLWDAGLHLAVPQSHIGAWYPLLCIGFDPIVTGYVLWQTAIWKRDS